MKFKYLNFLLLPLFSVSVYSKQNENIKAINEALISAKMAGMCGTFQQMLAFQNSTKMKGGDEFIARFASTELARLGFSQKQFIIICNRSIDTYNTYKNLTD